MEKSESVDLPLRPSISSLASAASSSQSSQRLRHFQYDVLSTNEIRLFKLDLAEEGEPLSGSLMTTYHHWNSFDFSKKSWVTRIKEDTEDVMKVLTGDKKYDTFSYSWGDQSETFPLYLSFISNDLGPKKTPKLDYEAYRNGTIRVGRNLRDLLEELRRRKHKRFVWIDAICINQNNDPEKRMQIPMMRDIYEYAGDGHVWFGVGSSEEAMSMRMLPGVTEKLKKARAANATVIPGKEESYEEIGVPEPDSRFWAALRGILKNPWWSRLWTLQEVVVPEKEGKEGFWSMFPATIVYLGSTSTELDTFNQLSIATAALGLRSWIITGQADLRADALYAFHGIDEIRICRESWVFDMWGVKLRALLLGTRRRRATIDADMVYGMLAMMDSHAAKILAPEANSTAQDVFIKFAKHYVRNEHREHLFGHLATESRKEGLPSWCPDFSSSPANTSLGSHWFGRVELSDQEEEQMYHAGYSYHGKWKLPRSRMAAIKGVANALRGRNVYHHLYDTNDPRQIAPMADSNHLLVSGIHMDVVAEVVECIPAARSTNFLSKESVALTEQWELQCLKLAMRYLSRGEEGVDGFDVYARTLATNRSSVELSSNRPIFFDHQYKLDFVECYRQFKDFIQIRRAIGDDFEAEDNLSSDTWHYMDVMSHVTQGRRFFVTDGGKIGLGPANTEVGDAVCVLFFCPTPYILRHYHTGRSQLVGEAYVHGVMYGEALAMLDSGQVQETKWVIE